MGNIKDIVMVSSEAKKVVVTGGNAGIGFALCKQLIVDHGCYIFMGSRSLERGEAALKSLIESSPECEGKIELALIDTCSEQSIIAARDSIKAKLGE